MGQDNRPAAADLASPLSQAKADARRRAENWRHVNRATRDEVQRMTDDDTRKALQCVLDGLWHWSGAADDGEGLIAFQSALRDSSDQPVTS